jgi:hypothetical protein
MKRLKAGAHPDRPVGKMPIRAAMLLQDMAKVEVGT